MNVGPSSKRSAWRDFFAARSWSPVEFARLIQDDDPGAAFFEIETQINGIYRAAQKAHRVAQQLGFGDPAAATSDAFLKAEWLATCAERFRRALGPAQREIDLGLMRWMRRASCLSLVAGAGVTMDAGGPSWAELVRRLLVLAVERGREVAEMRPTPESTPEHFKLRRVVTRVERLAPPAEARAREILSLVDGGSAGSEVLMEGAQLCHDLLGQHLFTDMTGVLYEEQREPGPIHRAIAELATPLHVPDRGGWFPGWDSIITYNFDDLIGEALDARGLARVAYAMRGLDVAGDPNELAQKVGQGGLHQPIFHLHGYTPRRLFLITKVQFVFSVSQYEKTYGGSRVGIIGHVFVNWLAQPIHHALYVGCSFADDAMNGLLRDAAEALPGRYHYALLKWAGPEPFPGSTPEDIAVASAPYHAMGVRPIWFDSFSEIPGLIRQLA